MKKVQASGEYTVKETNEKISFDYDYDVFDTTEDAIESLSDVKVLAMINQTVREDAGNKARMQARTANGHAAERKPLTEEEKQVRKESAKKKNALYKALQSNPAKLAELAEQLGLNI